MSTTGVLSAHVNVSALAGAFAAAARINLRPGFVSARGDLRADLRDHAKKQQGPDGTWPARAGSRRNRRPRKLLGRLPGALSIRSTRDRMVARSLVDWSAIHKTGGTAGRGARIPARDWLWASDVALTRIAGVLARFVAGALAGNAARATGKRLRRIIEG